MLITILISAALSFIFFIIFAKGSEKAVNSLEEEHNSFKTYLGKEKIYYVNRLEKAINNKIDGDKFKECKICGHLINKNRMSEEKVIVSKPKFSSPLPYFYEEEDCIEERYTCRACKPSPACTLYGVDIFVDKKETLNKKTKCTPQKKTKKS